jgi:hypothetical protein
MKTLIAVPLGYPAQSNTRKHPCKARSVWAGAVIFASATCSLQFTKASAAKLSQQAKNNQEDVQRGRVNISSFICTVAS